MKRFHTTRFDCAVLLGIVFSVMLANLSVFGRECAQVRGDVVRLHILANSDSGFDQGLKLRVRDRILAQVGGIFSAQQSQADAKAAAVASLPEIEAAARAALIEAGCEAPVRAEVCSMYFTTRQYDDLSLPAGIYDAVRVTIGTGAGHNWWCVMYPPICLPAAEPPESAALTEIEALNSEPLFKPKLAVVELLERFFPSKSTSESAI